MGELFDKVCSLPVLTDAWKRVRAKKAAGGLDDVTVEQFEADLPQNLSNLIKELRSGAYVPQPLERIHVPKFSGARETRPLSLPTVRDKIVQQAVRMVIEPLFNPIFLDCNYGYRPGKGPRKAYKRVNHYLVTEKRHWVALADFDRFFDSLDQEILIGEVAKVVDDPGVIGLVRMWCKIGFVNPKGDYIDMDSGIGQGPVISPLLSNIYAHPLDQYMIRKGYAYVRYSDNMIILNRTRKSAYQSLEDLSFFSGQVLRLALNENAHPVRSLDRGFVFLGIYYRNGLRAICREKMGKIRRQIKTIAHPKASSEALMEKLNRSLKGFRNYYSIFNPEDQFIELDNYLCKVLAPLLAEYVKQDLYRNLEELMVYIAPLEFTSRLFNEQKQNRLRELAGGALKLALSVEQKERQSRPLRRGIKDGIRSADKKISGRKRKYLKFQGLASEIVVSTHGAFLGRRGGRVVVSSHGKTLLSNQMDKTRSLMVAAKGVTLSSDLVRECSNRKIPIFFMDHQGPPYAMIHLPSSPHGRLSICQVEAKKNGIGTRIASRIVVGKIKNQLNLMKFYGRSREGNRVFMDKLDAMEQEVDDLTKEARAIPETEDDERRARDRLFSVEGRAASTYWALVKILLGGEMEFPGRVRKSAKDLVNSLLNYGYGMLYGRVWRAVAVAGLNPHISFLHEPGTNKPTLVFDLIEEFRAQAVDRAVFTMITRGEELELDKKTGLLEEETRKKVIQNVLERLASVVPYKGKKLQLDQVINLQPRNLARCLETGKTYRPFVGRY